ncbi:hypothetical protein PR048_007836 [Dryococelus australis]|uniref:Uncharacterized protein n=1 Tax=Dryococelus australis TaxID=614101 RepID=A0ABQ9HVD6_9NEOP|nr:hypothetical protein PR048_007836 [Dryococelus australis]
MHIILAPTLRREKYFAKNWRTQTDVHKYTPMLARDLNPEPPRREPARKQLRHGGRLLFVRTSINCKGCESQNFTTNKASSLRTGFNPRLEFCMWESCRKTPLLGGFCRGSPGFSTLSFRRCYILTSITVIGSQDFAKHGNFKGDRGMCISCLIASTRKTFNGRAGFIGDSPIPRFPCGRAIGNPQRHAHVVTRLGLDFGVCIDHAFHVVLNGLCVCSRPGSSRRPPKIYHLHLARRFEHKRNTDDSELYVLIFRRGYFAMKTTTPEKRAPFESLGKALQLEEKFLTTQCFIGGVSKFQLRTLAAGYSRKKERVKHINYLRTFDWVNISSALHWLMNAVKYRAVSGVVWTNRMMVSSNTDTNRTGVLAVVDIVKFCKSEEVYGPDVFFTSLPHWTPQGFSDRFRLCTDFALRVEHCTQPVIHKALLLQPMKHAGCDGYGWDVKNLNCAPFENAREVAGNKCIMGSSQIYSLGPVSPSEITMRCYTISDSAKACARSAIAAGIRASVAPVMAFPALHGQISYQFPLDGATARTAQESMATARKFFIPGLVISRPVPRIELVPILRLRGLEITRKRLTIKHFLIVHRQKLLICRRDNPEASRFDSQLLLNDKFCGCLYSYVHPCFKGTAYRLAAEKFK